MRLIAAIFLAVAVLIAGGCEKAEPQVAGDPVAATVLVADAARASFRASNLAVHVSAEEANAGWTADGLVQPGRGRFRVKARIDGPTPEGPRRVTVVGTDGEGYEATVLQTRGGFGFGSGRGNGNRICWFNPHAPVGFYGEPLSVEEAMRVSGSALESLRLELRSARATEAGRYLIEFEPSASRPRDDFKQTRTREWGERGLLQLVRQPVEVLVADGRVVSISLTLTDYRDDPGLLPRGSPHSREIRVRAQFAPTAEELLIEPPSCQAIE